MDSDQTPDTCQPEMTDDAPTPIDEVAKETDQCRKLAENIERFLPSNLTQQNISMVRPVVDFDKDNPPKVEEYNVEAYCVGGMKEFLHILIDNELYTAEGDDGHWWLTSICSIHWIPEMVESIQTISNEQKRDDNIIPKGTIL